MLRLVAGNGVTMTIDDPTVDKGEALKKLSLAYNEKRPIVLANGNQTVWINPQALILVEVEG